MQNFDGTTGMLGHKKAQAFRDTRYVHIIMQGGKKGDG